MRQIEIGATYKHFKGNYYKILDIVNNADSKDKNIEKIVIYQALYGNHEKWARKYEDFISEVDKNKYPNSKQKYRFEQVN